MSQINLPVSKSLGLEAAMMVMLELGWTRLQAAKWFRSIEWEEKQFSLLFDHDPGQEADIEYHFEIGFYGSLLVTIEVHLKRTGDGTTWKVTGAKAFNGHFPEEGFCGLRIILGAYFSLFYSPLSTKTFL